MTLTLAQARSVVSDHLDDADNARWSTSQIDVGLSAALSACLSDYAAAYGDRFDIIGSFSSTTSGVVDLSSVLPLTIRGVSILSGSRYWPIQQVSAENRGVNDTEARTVQVRYVRKYAIPSDTSHPLVGVGATAAPSWDAFDHWICVRAALHCSVKDAELRPELVTMEEQARDNVLSAPPVDGSRPFPGQRGYIGDWFAYFWNPGAVAINLVKK